MEKGSALTFHSTDSVIDMPDQCQLPADIRSSLHELNMPDFNRERDSLLVRVLYPDLMERTLLELRRTKGEWKAVLLTFKYAFESKQNKYVINSVERKEIVPKSSWKVSAQRILDSRICSLPDSKEIKGYINGIDGGLFTIECASETGSRCFQYWEPQINQTANIEAGIFTQFLGLIKSEFGIEFEL